MCVSLHRTETEKEVEKIGNISYKLDSTRIEHCVKLSGVHTVEKNKGRKMISSFFALAQKICLSPKGDFLLKGIYKKCNMSSAVRPVSEKMKLCQFAFLRCHYFSFHLPSSQP